MLLLMLLLLASPASAASLVWDATADGQFDVEFSETATGPFQLELRVAANPPKYPLVTGKFGYYRLNTEGGYSNVARYSLDVESDKMAELEARITLLEKPVVVGNITAKQLDANRIEIIGQACTSLKTSGTGLKRIVECVH
jgi:uncharacterized protein YecE (DUF72 family)